MSLTIQGYLEQEFPMLQTRCLDSMNVTCLETRMVLLETWRSRAFGNWWWQQTESDDSLKLIDLYLFLLGWLFELTSKTFLKTAKYHYSRIGVLLTINEQMMGKLEPIVNCLSCNNWFHRTELHRQCLVTHNMNRCWKLPVRTIRLRFSFQLLTRLGEQFCLVFYSLTTR